MRVANIYTLHTAVILIRAIPTNEAKRNFKCTVLVAIIRIQRKNRWARLRYNVISVGAYHSKNIHFFLTEKMNSTYQGNNIKHSLWATVSLFSK